MSGGDVGEKVTVNWQRGTYVALFVYPTIGMRRRRSRTMTNTRHLEANYETSWHPVASQTFGIDEFAKLPREPARRPRLQVQNNNKIEIVGSAWA